MFLTLIVRIQCEMVTSIIPFFVKIITTGLVVFFNRQKRVIPDGITRFWYARKDSLHYGVAAVQPSAINCPQDI